MITGYEMIRSLRNHSINAQTTVVFVADEIDEKSEYLAKALGVAGVLSCDTMSLQLQTLVTASM